MLDFLLDIYCLFSHAYVRMFLILMLKLSMDVTRASTCECRNDMIWPLGWKFTSWALRGGQLSEMFGLIPVWMLLTVLLTVLLSFFILFLWFFCRRLFQSEHNGRPCETVLNSAYPTNFSPASSFPTDFEIFPICQNEAVSQINDFTCCLARLTGWRGV